MRKALLLVCLAATAAANSYVPSPPLCERIQEYTAIFAGTVIKLPAPGKHDHLVRVDEVFLGHDPRQTEVIVEKNRDVTIGARSIFFSGRPFRYGHLRTYTVLETLIADPALIDELRALSRGRGPTRVSGSIIQTVTPIFSDPEPRSNPPLVGARVILASASQRFETVSGADGRYEFKGLPSGTYNLTVEKSPWRMQPVYRGAVELRAGGCAVRHVSMFSNAAITGTVIDRNGAPIGGVEIRYKYRHGTGREPYLSWTCSDNEGRYSFSHVPTGEYRIVTYGDASSPMGPFQIGPNTKLQNLTIRLPLVRRPVLVKTLLSNGSPSGPGAVVLAGCGLQGRTGDDGTVRFHVLPDRHHSFISNGFRGAALSPGAGPAIVELRSYPIR